MGVLTTTAAKGEFAILKVQMRAVELGVVVSRPIVEGTRYDLILDNGKLSRVQVKYVGSNSQRSSGAAHIRLSSTSRSQKKPRSLYTDEEIDAVIAYLPQIDKLCWLPPEVWRGKHSVVLRYDAPKNKQLKGCTLVKDYLW
jgi:hypothetical protein